MPRIKLGAIKVRPEVNQPALYLLIDSSGELLTNSLEVKSKRVSHLRIDHTDLVDRQRE